MKKALIIGLLAVVATVIWYPEENKGGVMTFRGWENPETRFDATKNETMDVRLRWRVVADVNKACSDESVRRGGKVFRYEVQACSFWEGKECVIVTPKMATIHNLGHETLHCFRGDFH